MSGNSKDQNFFSSWSLPSSSFGSQVQRDIRAQATQIAMERLRASRETPVGSPEPNPTSSSIPTEYAISYRSRTASMRSEDELNASRKAPVTGEDDEDVEELSDSESDDGDDGLIFAFDDEREGSTASSRARR